QTLVTSASSISVTIWSPQATESASTPSRAARATSASATWTCSGNASRSRWSLVTICGRLRFAMAVLLLSDHPVSTTRWRGRGGGPPSTSTDYGTTSAPVPPASIPPSTLARRSTKGGLGDGNALDDAARLLPRTELIAKYRVPRPKSLTSGAGWARGIPKRLRPLTVRTKDEKELRPPTVTYMPRDAADRLGGEPNRNLCSRTLACLDVENSPCQLNTLSHQLEAEMLIFVDRAGSEAYPIVRNEYPHVRPVASDTQADIARVCVPCGVSQGFPRNLICKKLDQWRASHLF